MTVVLITHNTAIAPMPTAIRMRNGSVVSADINPSPVSAERLEW